MRRTISGLLIGTMLMMFLAPIASAQDYDPFNEPRQKKAPQKAPEKEIILDPANSSLLTCDAKGKQDAKQHSTGGSFVGGLFGGVLLGLIGTGIAVLAQSESDPSATELLALEEMNEDCNYVYLDSYREEIQSRKRSAALTGGLIGTIVFVSIYLAATADE